MIDLAYPPCVCDRCGVLETEDTIYSRVWCIPDCWRELFPLHKVPACFFDDDGKGIGANFCNRCAKEVRPFVLRFVDIAFLISELNKLERAIYERRKSR